MANLYTQRILNERTVAALDELLIQIHSHNPSKGHAPSGAPSAPEYKNPPGNKNLSSVPLTWLVQCRNRLRSAGISAEQALELMDRFDSQRKREKDLTKELIEMGTPIERIIEYISAPTWSSGLTEGVAVKESIYNQIKLDYHRANQVDLKQLPKRVGYGLGAMAFVSSYSLIFLAAASTNPDLAERANEAGLVFDKINHLMWGALEWAGVPGTDLVSSNAPLGQLTALCGSLAYSEYQRNKGQAQRGNLRQKLHQPTSGLSEELFGKSKQKTLESRYELLTESDKHLLSHLSPYEIRVVLLGSEESAKDILRANPPPFENEVLAAAHSSTGWGEHFSKMLYLAMPKRARKVVDWVSSTKPLGIGGRKPFVHDDTTQMLDRLHSRRTQNTGAQPAGGSYPTAPLGIAGR